MALDYRSARLPTHARLVLGARSQVCSAALCVEHRVVASIVVVPAVEWSWIEPWRAASWSRLDREREQRHARWLELVIAHLAEAACQRRFAFFLSRRWSPRHVQKTCTRGPAPPRLSAVMPSSHLEDARRTVRSHLEDAEPPQLSAALAILRIIAPIDRHSGVSACCTAWHSRLECVFHSGQSA